MREWNNLPQCISGRQEAELSRRVQQVSVRRFVKWGIGHIFDMSHGAIWRLIHAAKMKRGEAIEEGETQ